MNRWATAGALLAAAGIALGLRCPRLREKPMHNDEGVNAVKFGGLWTRGVYRYDPAEYHGPTLPYATLLINRLTGAGDYAHIGEIRLRIVPVLFGAGLILLYGLLREGIGSKGVVWAGILTAVSPAMVYYSRYYIHEMLFVFFNACALICGWRYWRSRKIGWALGCGTAVALMYATKETFVLTLAAIGIGLGLNQLWNRKFDASGQPTHAAPLNWKHLLGGILVFVIVWALFFSSFFTNLKGLGDSISTYTHWIGRSEKTSVHRHEWSFYLHRLIFFHQSKGPIWSEAVIFILALAGMFAGFWRKGTNEWNASFVRFLSFFTLALTAMYSVLPYKTPWCLLSFWLGFCLLAGVGASVLIAAARFQWARVVACLALATGAAQLGAQAWQASTEYASNPQNPYVYAHTSKDVLELVRKVEAIAASSSDDHNLVIKVIAPDSDYWPLPWYLRDFPHTGWYPTLPPDPYAPIMIVSAQFNANLDEKGTHAMVGLFQLRPNVFFELYVEANLWKHYVAGMRSQNE